MSEHIKLVTQDIPFNEALVALFRPRRQKQAINFETFEKGLIFSVVTFHARLYTIEAYIGPFVRIASC